MKACKWQSEHSLVAGCQGAPTSCSIIHCGAEGHPIYKERFCGPAAISAAILCNMHLCQGKALPSKVSNAWGQDHACGDPVNSLASMTTHGWQRLAQ